MYHGHNKRQNMYYRRRSSSPVPPNILRDTFPPPGRARSPGPPGARQENVLYEPATPDSTVINVPVMKVPAGGGKKGAFKGASVGLSALKAASSLLSGRSSVHADTRRVCAGTRHHGNNHVTCHIRYVT